jgi:hypothetical protein
MAPEVCGSVGMEPTGCDLPVSLSATASCDKKIKNKKILIKFKKMCDA